MQGNPSQRLQRIPSQKTNAGKPKSKTAENPRSKANAETPIQVENK
jgi:hypothetical protein